MGPKLDKYQQDRNASMTRKRRDAAARAAATAAVKAAMLAADLHADKGSDKLSDLNKVLNWGRSKNSDKGKMNGSGKGSDQGSDKDVDVGAQSPAPGSSQGQGLAQGLTLAPAAMPMRQEPTVAGGGSGDEEGGTGSGQGRLTRGSMAGVMSGLDRVRRATLDIRNFNITTLMPRARRPTLQIHATAENDQDTPHKAQGQLSSHANSNHNDGHDDHDNHSSRRYSTNSTLHGSANKVSINANHRAHPLSHPPPPPLPFSHTPNPPLLLSRTPNIPFSPPILSHFSRHPILTHPYLFALRRQWVRFLPCSEL